MDKGDLRIMKLGYAIGQHLKSAHTHSTMPLENIESIVEGFKSENDDPRCANTEFP